jgi:hypothetical protein
MPLREGTVMDLPDQEELAVVAKALVAGGDTIEARVRWWVGC